MGELFLDIAKVVLLRLDDRRYLFVGEIYHIVCFIRFQFSPTRACGQFVRAMPSILDLVFINS